MDKVKRTLYEPPLARDLSGLSSTGLAPLGVCTVGYYPYVGCAQGADVASGSCEGGTTPDIGFQCRPFGSTADSICDGGGYQ